LFKSLVLVGPRLMLLVQSLTPPIAATLSWIFINDALGPRQWAAMGVALAGVAWVVLERPNGDQLPHAARDRRRGIMLAVFASATQAIGLVFSKEGIRGYDDAVAATLIRAMAALPCYAALLTFWHRWPSVFSGLRHPTAMLAMSMGALMGPFLGVALYMFALRHSPTGVVATIIATMPALILPISVLVYREKVSLRAVVGAIIAIVGVAMLVL
jgi:drug/metabolite transporter (DMT)-like permease